MSELRWKCRRSLRSVIVLFTIFALAFAFVSAERGLKGNIDSKTRESDEPSFFLRAVDFLWEPDQTGYHHVWPEFEFNWQIVVGTLVGFCGAAFGSVGGVGGGMIVGASVSTVYYNLRLRHPTLDMPIIDYDLALLIQPMLMLGISLGVAFNVMFPDWMVTVLLIILFLGTSTKGFLKGCETWNKETIEKMEAAKRLESNGVSGGTEVEYTPLPAAPSNNPGNNKKQEVSIIENVYWKELGLLVFVWIVFLALQIAKKNMPTCSVGYWVINLLQIPVAVGVSGYEAVALYQGRRIIASNGQGDSNFTIGQLILYCSFGILAGVVGGLLGLGGGFIMGPLFLELGVPPQVSSATATVAMTFSSSMSVVEYYLLKRFPVPYALYLVGVATIAALVGQHVVRRLITVLGRASLIIFILASTIFISAISLGGVGIVNMMGKLQRHEYMGFENLCKYSG
ncbi:sulfite exporter TauE/SafE family protein 3 isoform X2 [Raphanus sativus]|uniref:Sulfite exporter TauE/SafE family protein 3 isoform X2 n=1 Tax=Raphanus sativus TaxID=3726 RepID=A0A9W3DIK5_RAPSA|nr:sulfite exporter TauE/SafE family protein 3 isoform X2 [Raphanus sativus]